MLKHAVDNAWVVTKFKYITDAEYEKDYKNKMGCYFLKYMEWEILGIDLTKAWNSQICLFDFIVDKTGDNVKKGEIYEHYYTRPYGFRFTYKEISTITKRVKTDIKLEVRQSDVTFLVQWFNNKIDSKYDCGSLGITTASGPNKKANPIIHKKILVISQYEADVYGITEEKMKKQYDFPCKIVPEEELDKYIDSKDPTVVYIRSRMMRGTDEGKPLSFGSGESTFVFIVDAETGFCFYRDDDIQKSFVKAYIFRTLNK
jgi:hypothetical protein